MRNKIIAWVTLGCFMVFCYSCSIYSWKKTPLDSIKPEKREGLKISQAEIKSGESIEFSKTPPTLIQGDLITGEKHLRKLRIEKKDVVQVIALREKSGYDLKHWTPILVTTKNGMIYRAAILKDKKDHMICNAYESISIPLSDVLNVWQKKLSVPRLIVGFLAITILVGIIALLSMDIGSFAGYGTRFVAR